MLDETNLERRLVTLEQAVCDLQRKVYPNLNNRYTLLLEILKGFTI